MAPPAVKAAYPVLLLGLSVLFSVESGNVSVTEISRVSSTAGPSLASARPTTARVRGYETKAEPATRRPTRDPAGVNSTVAPESPLTSAAVAGEEPVTPNKSVEGRGEGREAVMSTPGAIPSSPGPPQPHTSSHTAAAAGEAQPSHNSTEPTEHQQSPSNSPDAHTPAASPATTPPSPSTSAAILPMNSTASRGGSARATASTQDSRPSSMTANHTSQGPPVFDLKSTSSPARDNETSAGLPPAPRTVSATPRSTDVAKLTTAAESPRSPAGTTTVSPTAASTGSSGVLVPSVPKGPTSPAARLTPTAPRGISKSVPGTDAPTCSTRGVVTTCLIVIASLAALATAFLVSTVVLCTKLSGRRYKMRTTQQETEMMCISALLPERPCGYAKQRNPVTNGVLVIHCRDDSDEDAGDNVTLSSFLPDQDRSV